MNLENMLLSKRSWKQKDHVVRDSTSVKGTAGEWPMVRSWNRVGVRGAALLPGGGVSFGWDENVLEQSVGMTAQHCRHARCH